MNLPEGAYRSRRWTDQSRLAIIDAEKRLDPDWLKPERRHRWVIAKLASDGEILIWGEETSRSSAIRTYEKLLAGRISACDVWHEKFQASEATSAVLAADRKQLQAELLQSLQRGVSMDELGGWVIEMARNATKRVGNACMEVPDYAVRLKAIDWITNRLVGTEGEKTEPEKNPQRSLAYEQARERFYSSNVFRSWALQKLAEHGHVVSGELKPDVSEERSLPWWKARGADRSERNSAGNPP